MPISLTTYYRNKNIVYASTTDKSEETSKKWRKCNFRDKSDLYGFSFVTKMVDYLKSCFDIPLWGRRGGIWRQTNITRMPLSETETHLKIFRATSWKREHVSGKCWRKRGWREHTYTSVGVNKSRKMFVRVSESASKRTSRRFLSAERWICGSRCRCRDG